MSSSIKLEKCADINKCYGRISMEKFLRKMHQNTIYFNSMDLKAYKIDCCIMNFN